MKGERKLRLRDKIKATGERSCYQKPKKTRRRSKDEGCRNPHAHGRPASARSGVQIHFDSKKRRKLDWSLRWSQSRSGGLYSISYDGEAGRGGSRKVHYVLDSERKKRKGLSRAERAVQEDPRRENDGNQSKRTERTGRVNRKPGIGKNYELGGRLR